MPVNATAKTERRTTGRPETPDKGILRAHTTPHQLMSGATSHGGAMRLYRAICAWLEASAASMSEPEEFGPEGAGEARSEHAHSFSAPPELHIRSDRQSLDDEDSGTYKRRPIGFTRH